MLVGIVFTFAAAISTIDITSERQFDDLVGDTQIHSLVEFYAPWCGHCMSFKPHFLAAAHEHTEVLYVLASDDAIDADALHKHGVEAFPTWKNTNGETRTGAFPSEKAMFEWCSGLPAAHAGAVRFALPDAPIAPAHDGAPRALPTMQACRIALCADAARARAGEAVDDGRHGAVR